jgi:phage repressor protein C with HTH and peptisase S24 domain
MQKQKTIGMRLREAFKCLGLNITEVARITGIPYPTLQDYLNDKRIPGGSNLQKISMHLHISIDWLLTGEGPMFRENLSETPSGSENEEFYSVDYYKDLPLSAGSGTFTFEEVQPVSVLLPRSFLEEYFHLKTHPGKGEFLLFPVHGNSMEPTIPSGSYVLVRRFEYEGLPRPKEGEIYALIYNAEFYLKRVCIRFLPDGRIFWKLFSDNPDYPPIEFETSSELGNEVTVIGRVLGYLKKI